MCIRLLSVSKTTLITQTENRKQKTERIREGGNTLQPPGRDFAPINILLKRKPPIVIVIRHNHIVTRLQKLHSFANLHDMSDPFVAVEKGVFFGPCCRAVVVQVAAADCGGVYAYYGVCCGLEGGDWSVDDRDVEGGAELGDGAHCLVHFLDIGVEEGLNGG